MSLLRKLFPSKKSARRSLQTAMSGDASVLEIEARTASETKYAESITIGARLPGFKSNAADQQDRRRKNALEDTRIRLRGAFTPAQPVTNRQVFAGRRDVLASLIRATEDMRLHTILYGERGLGKTSVLHVFAQAAADARYLTVYISCGTRSTFDEEVRSVLAHIALLYRRGSLPTSPEVEQGGTFADILPGGGLSVQAAGDALAQVFGTRVIVILDEFDRCQSQDFRLAMAELLKNLSDRAVRVQFVIAGVAANFRELIEHIPSIDRTIFALQVHPMTPKEIREFVKHGEIASGLHFEDAAVANIVQVANGFPYFASLLSLFAGLRALGDERSTVTLHDFRLALRDVVEEFGGRLPNALRAQVANSIGAEQLQMLGVLAGTAQISGPRFDQSDVQAALLDAEVAERCKRFIDGLSNARVVLERQEGSHASYRFVDDMLVPYIWFVAAEARLRNGEGSEFGLPKERSKQFESAARGP